MVLQAGRYQLGTERGQIVLRTGREGMAATAGHDLTIVVGRWSGELTVGEDGSPAGLDVQADLHSLIVREGTGGVKPLTDRDRREIGVSTRKVLAADRYPQATFTATEFQPDGDGGGVIAGTLTVAGQARPLRLQVRPNGPDKYQATGTVVQSAHGITPYRGFFGALKVRDSVGVEIDLDLSQAEATADQGSGEAQS
jgi:polyisoprenoid-binding protein YceI